MYAPFAVDVREPTGNGVTTSMSPTITVCEVELVGALALTIFHFPLFFIGRVGDMVDKALTE